MLIIWTLRRTGGTNFTRWLCSLLESIYKDIKCVEHEPFNLDRCYGHITKLEDENEKRALLLGVLKERQLIKQRVETIPEKFCLLLADITNLLGYKHLFLYRMNFQQRLLSLHFAKITDIWGPKQYSEDKINRELFNNPIPIEELITQELLDRSLLRRVYKIIRSKKDACKEITYETLYEEEVDSAIEKIRDITNDFLGLNLEKQELIDFINSLRAKGKQNTEKYYDLFPNIKKAYSEFSKLSQFKLDPFNVDWDYLAEVGELPFPEGELKRLDARKYILKFAKIGGIGAEIGVYRGNFAEVLLNELKPKKIYLVDPWSKIGEKFGWGETSPYTAFGKVTTKYAREDTKRKVLPYVDVTEINIIEDCVENVSFSEKLDWIYLDTSHSYEDTKRQLGYLTQYLQPEGVLIGDDWNPEPSHIHHGVFKAVNEFIKSNPEWEIVACGTAAQWCIRRRLNILLNYKLDLLGNVASNQYISDWYIDPLPKRLEDGLPIYLKGVIVINKNFKQEDFELFCTKSNGESIYYEWYINSPYFAQKHSENPNAKRARFSFSPFTLKNGESVVLGVIKRSSEDKIDVLRIQRND